jgi:hypothetical protein
MHQRRIHSHKEQLSRTRRYSREAVLFLLLVECIAQRRQARPILVSFLPV